MCIWRRQTIVGRTHQKSFICNIFVLYLSSVYSQLHSYIQIVSAYWCLLSFGVPSLDQNLRCVAWRKLFWIPLMATTSITKITTIVNTKTMMTTKLSTGLNAIGNLSAYTLQRPHLSHIHNECALHNNNER